MRESASDAKREIQNTHGEFRVEILASEFNKDSMSVWASAIISHTWPGFSETLIQRIAKTVSNQDARAEWRIYPPLASPEEEFATDGNAYFRLPQNYSFCFSRKVIELNYAIRWSAVLISEAERGRFLEACKRLAEFNGSDALLILPEGTELERFALRWTRLRRIPI